MAGIICLDKPEGITSSKALAIVRRLAGTKKAGHTGTLDPMATGVLPIFLGRSTRLIGALPPRAKEYCAQVCLGLTTDTLDITGTVLERREAHVTREQLGGALDAFVGTTLQTPPMYSAVSVNGVRLYELARQGIEVERKRRRITVYSISAADFREGEQEFILTVRCSEGTYIRTIADDLGRMLGCGACLKALRRTYSTGFALSDCITLDQARALAESGHLAERILPEDRAFLGYAPLTVAQTQVRRLRNGAPLALDRIGRPAPGIYRVYERETGMFVGLGRADHTTGEFRAKSILPAEEGETI